MSQQDMFGVEGSTDEIFAHFETIEDKRVWPKDLAEISDFVHAELERAGFQDDDLYMLIDAIMVGFAFRSGGKGFYLPKADRLKVALRDARVWHEFDGRNIRQLTERYKLSEQKVYEIIREQRALTTKRMQRPLFEEES